MSNHYAIIPAREFSKSFPYKNRKLLKYTLKFIEELNWINNVFIYTDDKYFDKYSSSFIEIIKRKRSDSKGNESIKSVLLKFFKIKKFESNDIFWLFYLTIPYKNKKNYEESYNLINKKTINSIISMIEVKTHPYDCWSISKNKIKNKFIKNDVFRRQDKPKLYEHHHYISAFKLKCLNKLNSELVCKDTYPYIINKKIANKLIEIDTKEEFQEFFKKK